MRKFNEIFILRLIFIMLKYTLINIKIRIIQIEKFHIIDNVKMFAFI